MNLSKIEAGMRLVLEGLEVDLSDHNFATTPQRAAKFYQEIFCPPPTDMVTFDERYTDLVVMRGHHLVGVCPHHLLPVQFVASVAYIPNGKVIGASKLVRIIHEANCKPKTQEMLTAEILQSIGTLTKGTSRGAAVKLVGAHGCMSMRGVRSEANMLTLKFSGEFETSQEMQRRFLDLAREA